MIDLTEKKKWHIHYIFCPHCNHRQQGAGCERIDCKIPISSDEKVEKDEKGNILLAERRE